jgi:tartrate-resistant acid phosphatase type 5
LKLPDACSAVAMGQFSKQKPVDFVLLLGDNYYDDGIPGDATSFRFKDTFEDVFTAPTLQDMPYFAVLGNHDYLGNFTAEVAYTELSPRWEMPSTYYTQQVQYNGTDGKAFSVHFVAIDTVALAGLTHGDDPTEQPPGAPDAALAQSQWDWIEQQLSTSTAEILIVMGHYPVFSGCSHGPTLALEIGLEPLLEKYGAHYFSGHDHCQEYIEYKNVSYVLTGVGHGCCYSFSNEGLNPAGSIKWYHASTSETPRPIDRVYAEGDIPDAGFVAVDVDSDGWQATYFNAALNVQYTTPLIPPRSSTLIERARLNQ